MLRWLVYELRCMLVLEIMLAIFHNKNMMPPRIVYRESYELELLDADLQLQSKAATVLAWGQRSVEPTRHQWRCGAPTRYSSPFFLPSAASASSSHVNYGSTQKIQTAFPFSVLLHPVLLRSSSSGAVGTCAYGRHLASPLAPATCRAHEPASTTTKQKRSEARLAGTRSKQKRS